MPDALTGLKSGRRSSPGFEIAACAVQIAMAAIVCRSGRFTTPALVDFVMLVNRLARLD
jgi:hypothetical protein